MGWDGSKAGVSGWDRCNWGYHIRVAGFISAAMPGIDERFKTLLGCAGLKVATVSDQRVSKKDLRAVRLGLERVKGMVRSNRSCSLISRR